MPGCAKCEDFTAECADISAGNIGSPDGYTTLITRTETGSDITAIAIDSGFIKIGREVDVSAIHAASARKKRLEGAGADVVKMNLPEEMALDGYLDAEVSG
jgi:coenzyme F420 hydrogenase subunit beta